MIFLTEDTEVISLNDRMKALEDVESKRATTPNKPVIIRLDGKNFSKWTKGLKFPFDERLEEIRREVTVKMVKYFDALIGYHCSDEITLVLFKEGEASQIHANGRLQKIVSHTASVCTAYWNEAVRKFIPDKKELAIFDSRAWEVPSLTEVSNALLWRERECIKNSINMASDVVYPHSELMGRHTGERKEMLLLKGINWEDYPVWARRGTFVGRVHFNRKLNEEELIHLPEKHNARKDPDMVVNRSEIRIMDIPPFNSILNKEEFIRGEEPIV
jgi:hypothetical protein